MEPDEIGMVLSRASELHGRISEAMERASQAGSQESTGSGNASRSNERNGDDGDRPSSSDADGNGQKKDRGEKASSSRESSEEAKSLGVIRNALEVLEEQLESMQDVQLQQRTQKEAALTQLEESRRSLLTKLKEHNGKEWQVVQQALAFAGEPVENRDDLRLPPYPIPLSKHSSPGDRPSPRHGHNPPKYNGSLRNMSLDHEEPPDDEENNTYMDNGNDDNNFTHYHEAHHQRRQGGGLFGFPWGFSRAFLAHAYTVTAKVAIVAACVAAALAIGEFGQTLDENMSSPFGSRKRNSSPPSPPNTECPPGQKLVLENGQTKCIVRERVELPFAKELNDPDALHGRG